MDHDVNALSVVIANVDYAREKLSSFQRVHLQHAGEHGSLLMRIARIAQSLFSGRP